jgi:hypothetical protein
VQKILKILAELELENSRNIFESTKTIIAIYAGTERHEQM